MKMVQSFAIFSGLALSFALILPLNSMADSAQAGVGIQIEKNTQGDIQVDQALENSPALKAGLEKDDLVEGVQTTLDSPWVFLHEKTLEQAVELIRGTAGTEEILLIKRLDKEFSVTLTRQPLGNSF